MTWEDCFKLWEWERNAQGRLYSPDWQQYRSPQNIGLVKAEAQKLSHLPCVSAFIIAFDKAKTSGAIRPVRAASATLEAATADTAKEFVLTAEQFLRIPASESKRRYAQDPSFRDAVEELIARGEI